MYSFREHTLALGNDEITKQRWLLLQNLSKQQKENADLLLSQSSECVCSRDVCLLESVKTINDSS